MINYYDLPCKLHSYIKEVDYKKIIGSQNGHNLRPVELQKFITQEGIDWFFKRKLYVRRALLFSCSSNFVGGIHIDANISNEYGINFVLEGDGEMQWAAYSEQNLIDKKAIPPSAYKNEKNFNIIDNWSGTTGLVRINIPHRVVTKNSTRYCLSLRTVGNESPKTFEEAMNLLYD